VLCLDVSSSTSIASTQDVTSDIIQQITAVLGFVAESEHDSIGLILFSDIIEKFIPPSRGHKHTMYLMETIFSYKPKRTKTDMNVLCRYLIESFRKDAVAIIVSDFIVSDFERSLKQLACKREIIAIRCLDSVVKKVPSVGHVWGQDPETKSTMLLHFSAGRSTELQKKFDDRINSQNHFLKKCNIDYVDVPCDSTFMQTLILFCKQRMVVP